MKTSRSLLYGTGCTLLRVALGFYFARIERFHPENVPAIGPVLFTLIVHLPHLERARIVEAVKRLYLDQCLVPYGLVQWIVKGFRQMPGGKTGVSAATILSGWVVFTAFYALCIFVFHYCFNWRVTFWYALSLPVASLAAHYYVRELRRFAASLRAVAVLVRAPSAAQSLLAARAELIALIEAVRQDMAWTRVGGKGEMSR